MAGQVIANPEELEKFAGELKLFNENLQNSMARLNGSFARLGDTWRDQEYNKFLKDYQNTVRALNQFLKASEEQHIPLLKKKARILRDYGR